MASPGVNVQLHTILFCYQYISVLSERAKGNTMMNVPTDCYIDGRWQPAADRATFTVLDPATGAGIAEVADGTAADGLQALTAASGAAPRWAGTPARERADLLAAAYREVVARTEEFAAVITAEMGKPLAESRGEVYYAAQFLRWFAEQTVRISGEVRTTPEADARILTLQQPVGPSLLIAPWNFPLAMITRKIGPALAAGCTVVVKPAEEAPLAALLLTRVLHDVGVAPGVVNVVPTGRPADLSSTLLADTRLRKVSFTGSTPVGRILLAGAAANVVRTSMELGGNSAFVVFDDADLDSAVDGVMLAKFRNGGQSCVAANRILVQDGIAEAFTDRVLQRVRAMRTGPGTEPGVDLGPMINARQRQRVHRLVTDAIDDGARARCGAELPQGPGFFYPPTVLTDVPAGSRIAREEIFGPVLAISTFDTEEQAVAASNDTEYGLVDYLFTNDLRRTFRVAEALQAGMIGINRGLVSNAAAPFGGVKQSGLGREGGFEGIREYLEVKYLALDEG